MLMECLLLVVKTNTSHLLMIIADLNLMILPRKEKREDAGTKKLVCHLLRVKLRFKHHQTLQLQDRYSR